MERRNFEFGSLERGHETFRIGCSSDKLNMFRSLVNRFTRLRRQSDQRPIDIEVVRLEDEIVSESLEAAELDAFCPDSSMWISRLEGVKFEEFVVFAVSPLVIVISPDFARRLAFPTRPISWNSLWTESQENPDFKWVHPNIHCAAGILTARAMYEAVPSNLGNADYEMRIDAEAKEYVRTLERHVEYAPTEQDTIQIAIREGKWQVDAFIAQEHLVTALYDNMEPEEQPIIVYPQEGTAWLDHPFIRISRESDSQPGRENYEALRNYLVSEDAQSILSRHGFHPAGPQIASYFSTHTVDPIWSGLQFTMSARALHNPSTQAISSLVANWYTVKRKAKVFLLADVSGSMRGHKLERAKDGLLEFIEMFESKEDRIGLITFESRVRQELPSSRLFFNKSGLISTIQSLQTKGQTSLHDAISMAYDELIKEYPDDDPFRAILVMTDGIENNSTTTLNDLVIKITGGIRNGFHVALFVLGYGQDADLDGLRELVNVTRGLTFEGNPSNISRVYKRIADFI